LKKLSVVYFCDLPVGRAAEWRGYLLYILLNSYEYRERFPLTYTGILFCISEWKPFSIFIRVRAAYVSSVIVNDNEL